MVEFGQVWFLCAIAFLAGAALTGLVLLCRSRRPRPSQPVRSAGVAGGDGAVPRDAGRSAPPRNAEDARARPPATGRVPGPRGPARGIPDIPAQGGPVDGPARPWKPERP
jgi:hypothetical protein